jgi:8-oxo-dGTP pyrophosphatase MutT (NUDIX family)
MKVKKSYGIALCRRTGAAPVEVLLVKKRYTYHFSEFVFGRYKKHDTKHLMHLFNNMTYAEKICILNMKFSEMWYKIWLSDPEKSYFYGYNQIRDGKISLEKKPKRSSPQERIAGAYFKKKSKFESAFVKDSGKRLLDLINVSSNSEAPWDIPKGHKHATEKDLDTARREFEEETGIDPKNYTMMWNVDPIIMTYQSCDGVVYKHYYYLAQSENDWDPKVSFKKYSQVVEVECVKWVGMRDIQFLQLNPDHKNRMVKLFTSIINLYKKHTKPGTRLHSI